ncbi:MAG: hypothetical protein AAFV88_01400 [Planctomycetota bacterium]
MKWDGGGDECLFTISIDQQEQDYDPDCPLSELVIEVLSIPSVGESFMSGTGVLKLEGESLLIHHRSRVYGASWDHIDMSAPGFEPSEFDWDENMRDVDKNVEETVVLCN